MSVILFPKFLLARNQFVLNIIFSLAVLDCIRKNCQNAENFRIKWPNDIYYSHFKLGGILIENSVMGSGISDCILGLGLNVNQIDFPDNLPNPISLKLIEKREFEREKIISDLIEFFEKRYLRIKNHDIHTFHKEYYGNLIGYNEIITVKNVANNKIFNATVTGVDEIGRIEVLNKDDGSTNKFSFKEIEFIFESQ